MNYRNELAAGRALQGKIRMPAILYHAGWKGREIILYEYIPSVSLNDFYIPEDEQKRRTNLEDIRLQTPYSNGIADNPVIGRKTGTKQDKNTLPSGVIEQAARAAALIHNTPEAEVSGLWKEDIPPFEMWFPLFLLDPLTTKRLGKELTEAIKEVVQRYQRELDEINRHHSFIHCDFRPANMLLDRENNLYVVDWESAGFGHTLADVGQFFRYRARFRDDEFKRFEKAYNETAASPLPENWQELSRLRDLVNPLQMLGAEQEQPEKYADLIALADETARYFLK